MHILRPTSRRGRSVCRIHGYSSGARWFALFCILVMGVVTTAQAAHFHRLASPSEVHQAQPGSDHSSAPSDEEHCPLCIAAHVALPATMISGPAPATLVTAVAGSCTELAPVLAWHFAWFSRPPPAGA